VEIRQEGRPLHQGLRPDACIRRTPDHRKRPPDSLEAAPAVHDARQAARPNLVLASVAAIACAAALASVAAIASVAALAPVAAIASVA